MDGQPRRTPEDRARLAERAMSVVNEHPEPNVRRLYAGEVAAEVGLPVDRPGAGGRAAQPSPDAHRRPARGGRRPARTPSSRRSPSWPRTGTRSPSWLVEELFHDEANRRAFLALAAAHGKLDAAIEAADPEAREVLERAAVADLEVDPDAEARNLIGAAVRRQLANAVRRAKPS